MSFHTVSGRQVTVGRLLKAGGEGEVYAVTAPPGMVFKKYTQETLVKAPATEAKLLAMTANPPAERREAASGHITLAWPTEVVLENGRFAGFLMPAIDTGTSVELHRLANPSDRRAASGKTAWMRGFSWRYLVSVAANLAHATDVLHNSGSVIGDFNERNILVTSQARVTLIDCDSMQFTAAGGTPYLCRVGRPEFTPPELSGVNWSTTFRQPSSDLFALAIHIYQLLMEGEHPFRGVWSGAGEKPSVPELARTGTWTFDRGRLLAPRPVTIDIGLLPDSMREMFRQAFADGATRPSRRPTAAAWQRALNGLAGGLRRCGVNREHLYPPHQARCPWCELERSRASAATQAIPATQPVPASATRPRLVPTAATTGFPPRTTASQPPRPTIAVPVPSAAGPSLTDTGLSRVAGRSRLFMLSAGSIFGASWLLGAGYAAQLAGPASLLAWLIGGAAALALAVVTAELSAMFPVAGGLARFPARAFGGIVGAAFGWTAWLQAAAVTALEVVTAQILLGQALNSRQLADLTRDGIGQPTGHGYAWSVGLTIAFTALNFCGIGAASWLNSVLTWVRLGTIGFTIVELLGHFDKLNLTHPPGGLLPFGAQSVFSAVGGGGIMFAYLGFEQAGQVAGEARRPKDVPYAIMAPVVLAAVAYITLQVAFIGAIPAGELAHGWGAVPDSALDLVKAHAAGHTTPAILQAAPAVGALGTALAYSVTAPRLAYGLGRSGLAPAFLARATRNGVPWAALLATFAGTLVLLLPGATWQQTIGDLTSASALMYAGAPLCLGAFRRQFPAQPRPYRLPAAGLLAPVAFSVATLIVYWCGWETNLRVGVALIVGTVIMLALRRPATRNLKAVAWLVVYLAGLGLLSRLGQYGGGSGTLPMWWDMAFSVIFSVVIYHWALRTRL